MLRWSINLFRIGGIQLAVHPSFFLLPVAVSIEGWMEEGSEGAFYALVFLLSFFVCVVLHELGHCLAALRLGIRVPRILLLPIGGMAEFESIPRSSILEILIALAGPAVNLVILGLLLLIADLPVELFDLDSWTEPYLWTPWNGFLLQLVIANAVMAAFNLLPVFPMDGGRVLRAALALKLPYLQATRMAALVARLLGGLLVAVCLWQSIWLPACLFAFILFVGEIEYRSVRRQEEEAERWKKIWHDTGAGGKG